MHNYDRHTDLIKRLRSLPKFGQTNTPNSSEEYFKAKQEFDSLLDQAGTLTKLFSNFSPILKHFQSDLQDVQHGLSLVVEQQTAYNRSIVDLVKNVTYFDQVEARVAKTLGISTKKSYELTKVYGKYIGQLKTTRENLDKYRATLDSILPMQSENLSKLSREITETDEFGNVTKKLVNYTDGLIKSQQHLQQYQGLSANEAKDYLLYTEGSGKNIGEQLLATQDLAEAWETATGQTGVYNTILRDISALSADIRSEYSRMGGNLEIAVLKSKQLGFSMEQLDTVGKHLLNIEESVGKEIEYQLISGRRLVDTNGRSLTMRFREAKLMGDGVKMAETMNDLVATQGDIIEKGSFLQKQALADSLGMSVEQLVVAKQRLEINKKVAAAAGMDFEKYSALSKKEQQAEIEKFKKAESKKAKGTSKEDQQAAVIENAKANLAALESLQTKEIDLQTPADRTVVALESMRDNGIFIRQKGQAYQKFDEGALVEDIKTTLSNQMLSNRYALENIGRMNTNLKTVNIELDNVVKTLQKMPMNFDKIFTSIKIENVQKAINYLKGFTIAGVTIFGDASKTSQGAATTTSTDPIAKPKDAIVMNDGVVQFHPSDKFMRVNDSTMIAGTSVDGNKKLAKTLGGGGMDMNKMVAAIQTAFSGVQITVNVDPMKIDREIKFRTATINSKQGRV